LPSKPPPVAEPEVPT
jgi:hypothetical protein